MPDDSTVTYQEISPALLKRMLEKLGYRLIDADDITWIMECGGHIIPIPQTMTTVPADILDSMLGPSGITSDAFNLLVSELKKVTVSPSQSAAHPN
jgi:hypothetical protein